MPVVTYAADVATTGGASSPRSARTVHKFAEGRRLYTVMRVMPHYTDAERRFIDEKVDAILERRTEEAPKNADVLIACDDNFRFMIYNMFFTSIGCHVVATRDIYAAQALVAPPFRDREFRPFDLVLIDKSKPSLPLDIPVKDWCATIRQRDREYMKTTNFVVRNVIVSVGGQGTNITDCMSDRSPDLVLRRPLLLSMDWVRKLLLPPNVTTKQRIEVNRSESNFSRIAQILTKPKLAPDADGELKDARPDEEANRRFVTGLGRDEEEIEYLKDVVRMKERDMLTYAQTAVEDKATLESKIRELKRMNDRLRGDVESAKAKLIVSEEKYRAVQDQATDSRRESMVLKAQLQAQAQKSRRGTGRLEEFLAGGARANELNAMARSTTSSPEHDAAELALSGTNTGDNPLGSFARSPSLSPHRVGSVVSPLTRRGSKFQPDDSVGGLEMRVPSLAAMDDPQSLLRTQSSVDPTQLGATNTSAKSQGGESMEELVDADAKARFALRQTVMRSLQRLGENQSKSVGVQCRILNADGKPGLGAASRGSAANLRTLRETARDKREREMREAKEEEERLAEEKKAEESAQHKLAEEEAYVSKLKEHIARLLTEVDNLSATVKEQDQIIVRAQDQAVHARHTLKQTQSELAAAKDKIKTMSEDIDVRDLQMMLGEEYLDAAKQRFEDSANVHRNVKELGAPRQSIVSGNRAFGVMDPTSAMAAAAAAAASAEKKRKRRERRMTIAAEKALRRKRRRERKRQRRIDNGEEVSDDDGGASDGHLSDWSDDTSGTLSDSSGFGSNFSSPFESRSADGGTARPSATAESSGDAERSLRSNGGRQITADVFSESPFMALKPVGAAGRVARGDLLSPSSLLSLLSATSFVGRHQQNAGGQGQSDNASGAGSATGSPNPARALSPTGDSDTGNGSVNGKSGGRKRAGSRRQSVKRSGEKSPGAGSGGEKGRRSSRSKGARASSASPDNTALSDASGHGDSQKAPLSSRRKKSGRKSGVGFVADTLDLSMNASGRGGGGAHNGGQGQTHVHPARLLASALVERCVLMAAFTKRGEVITTLTDQLKTATEKLSSFHQSTATPMSSPPSAASLLSPTSTVAGGGASSKKFGRTPSPGPGRRSHSPQKSGGVGASKSTNGAGVVSSPVKDSAAVRQLSGEIEDLRSDIANTQKELTVMTKRAEDAEARESKIKSMYDKKSARVDPIEKQTDSIRKDMFDAQKAAESAVHEKETVQRQASLWKETLDTNVELLDTERREKSEVQSLLHAANADIKTLQHRLESAQDTIAKLENMKRMIELSAKGQNDRSAILETDLRKAYLRMARMEEAVAQLQQQAEANGFEAMSFAFSSPENQPLDANGNPIDWAAMALDPDKAMLNILPPAALMRANEDSLAATPTARRNSTGDGRGRTRHDRLSSSVLSPKKATSPSPPRTLGDLLREQQQKQKQQQEKEQNNDDVDVDVDGHAGDDRDRRESTHSQFCDTKSGDKRNVAEGDASRTPRSRGLGSSRNAPRPPPEKLVVSRQIVGEVDRAAVEELEAQLVDLQQRYDELEERNRHRKRLVSEANIESGALRSRALSQVADLDAMKARIAESEARERELRAQIDELRNPTLSDGSRKFVENSSQSHALRDPSVLVDQCDFGATFTPSMADDATVMSPLSAESVSPNAGTDLDVSDPRSPHHLIASVGKATERIRSARSDGSDAVIVADAAAQTKPPPELVDVSAATNPWPTMQHRATSVGAGRSTSVVSAVGVVDARGQESVSEIDRLIDASRDHRSDAMEETERRKRRSTTTAGLSSSSTSHVGAGSKPNSGSNENDDGLLKTMSYGVQVKADTATRIIQTDAVTIDGTAAGHLEFDDQCVQTEEEVVLEMGLTGTCRSSRAASIYLGRTPRASSATGGPAGDLAGLTLIAGEFVDDLDETPDVGGDPLTHAGGNANASAANASGGSRTNGRAGPRSLGDALRELNERHRSGSTSPNPDATGAAQNSGGASPSSKKQSRRGSFAASKRRSSVSPSRGGKNAASSHALGSMLQANHSTGDGASSNASPRRGSSTSKLPRRESHRRTASFTQGSASPRSDVSPAHSVGSIPRHSSRRASGHSPTKTTPKKTTTSPLKNDAAAAVSETAAGTTKNEKESPVRRTSKHQFVDGMSASSPTKSSAVGGSRGGQRPPRTPDVPFSPTSPTSPEEPRSSRPDDRNGGDRAGTAEGGQRYRTASSPPAMDIPPRAAAGASQSRDAARRVTPLSAAAGPGSRGGIAGKVGSGHSSASALGGGRRTTPSEVEITAENDPPVRAASSAAGSRVLASAGHRAGSGLGRASSRPGRDSPAQFLSSANRRAKAPVGDVSEFFGAEPVSMLIETVEAEVQTEPCHVKLMTEEEARTAGLWPQTKKDSARRGRTPGTGSDNSTPSDDEGVAGVRAPSPSTQRVLEGADRGGRTSLAGDAIKKENEPTKKSSLGLSAEKKDADVAASKSSLDKDRVDVTAVFDKEIFNDGRVVMRRTCEMQTAPVRVLSADIDTAFAESEAQTDPIKPPTPPAPPKPEVRVEIRTVEKIIERTVFVERDRGAGLGVFYRLDQDGNTVSLDEDARAVTVRTSVNDGVPHSPSTETTKQSTVVSAGGANKSSEATKASAAAPAAVSEPNRRHQPRLPDHSGLKIPKKMIPPPQRVVLGHGGELQSTEKEIMAATADPTENQKSPRGVSASSPGVPTKDGMPEGQGDAGTPTTTAGWTPVVLRRRQSVTTEQGTVRFRRSPAIVVVRCSAAQTDGPQFSLASYVKQHQQQHSVAGIATGFSGAPQEQASPTSDDQRTERPMLDQSQLVKSAVAGRVSPDTDKSTASSPTRRRSKRGAAKSPTSEEEEALKHGLQIILEADAASPRDVGAAKSPNGGSGASALPPGLVATVSERDAIIARKVAHQREEEQRRRELMLKSGLLGSGLGAGAADSGSAGGSGGSAGRRPKLSPRGMASPLSGRLTATGAGSSGVVGRGLGGSSAAALSPRVAASMTLQQQHQHIATAVLQQLAPEGVSVEAFAMSMLDDATKEVYTVRPTCPVAIQTDPLNNGPGKLPSNLSSSPTGPHSPSGGRDGGVGVPASREGTAGGRGGQGTSKNFMLAPSPRPATIPGSDPNSPNARADSRGGLSPHRRTLGGATLGAGSPRGGVAVGSPGLQSMVPPDIPVRVPTPAGFAAMHGHGGSRGTSPSSTLKLPSSSGVRCVASVAVEAKLPIPEDEVFGVGADRIKSPEPEPRGGAPRSSNASAAMLEAARATAQSQSQNQNRPQRAANAANFSAIPTGVRSGIGAAVAPASCQTEESSFISAQEVVDDIDRVSTALKDRLRADIVAELALLDGGKTDSDRKNSNMASAMTIGCQTDGDVSMQALDASMSGGTSSFRRSLADVLEVGKETAAAQLYESSRQTVHDGADPRGHGDRRGGTRRSLSTNARGAGAGAGTRSQSSTSLVAQGTLAGNPPHAATPDPKSRRRTGTDGGGRPPRSATPNPTMSTSASALPSPMHGRLGSPSDLDTPSASSPPGSSSKLYRRGGPRGLVKPKKFVPPPTVVQSTQTNDIEIVVAGSSTKLVAVSAQLHRALHNLFQKVRHSIETAQDVKLQPIAIVAGAKAAIDHLSYDINVADILADRLARFARHRRQRRAHSPHGQHEDDNFDGYATDVDDAANGQRSRSVSQERDPNGTGSVVGGMGGVDGMVQNVAGTRSPFGRMGVNSRSPARGGGGGGASSGVRRALHTRATAVYKLDDRHSAGQGPTGMFAATSPALTRLQQQQQQVGYHQLSPQQQYQQNLQQQFQQAQMQANQHQQMLQTAGVGVGLGGGGGGIGGGGAYGSVSPGQTMPAGALRGLLSGPPPASSSSWVYGTAPGHPDPSSTRRALSPSDVVSANAMGVRGVGPHGHRSPLSNRSNGSTPGRRRSSISPVRRTSFDAPSIPTSGPHGLYTNDPHYGGGDGGGGGGGDRGGYGSHSSRDPSPAVVRNAGRSPTFNRHESGAGHNSGRSRGSLPGIPMLKTASSPLPKIPDAPGQHHAGLSEGTPSSLQGKQQGLRMERGGDGGGESYPSPGQQGGDQNGGGATRAPTPSTTTLPALNNGSARSNSNSEAMNATVGAMRSGGQTNAGQSPSGTGGHMWGSSSGGVTRTTNAGNRHSHSDPQRAVHSDVTGKASRNNAAKKTATLGSGERDSQRRSSGGRDTDTAPSPLRAPGALPHRSPSSNPFGPRKQSVPTTANQPGENGRYRDGRAHDEEGNDHLTTSVDPSSHAAVNVSEFRSPPPQGATPLGSPDHRPDGAGGGGGSAGRDSSPYQRARQVAPALKSISRTMPLQARGRSSRRVV